MDAKHVSGKNRGSIFLYALSTCVWCKKTKSLLNDLGLEYSYVDVDLLPASEEAHIDQEMQRWNPRRSFPTVVINNETCIVGFQPDKIKEALGL